MRVWWPDPLRLQLGGFSTHNFSEWPSEGDVSLCALAEVLETGPLPPHYYLSAKACRGILRRAAKRGKELPILLQRALEMAADAP